MSYKPNFSIKSLLEVGAHFGHKKNLWNPEMGKYIYGVKNKIHIIDLQQTAHHLYNTLQVVFSIASKNGRILFVNTKKQSTDVVKSAATKCGQYYVNHRWLGGMLTNWSTVSSSIKTLKKYEEVLESEEGKYTKKELLNFSRKKEKLEKAIGGIRNLGGLPDILFIIDVKTHATAVHEANKLNIPVIAIVDTNSSPKGVDFVIPGNDDSRKSIELYCNLVADAILAGIENSLSSQGVDLEKLSNTDNEKKEGKRNNKISDKKDKDNNKK
jgi:small subunit ribosomal protein S2